MTQYTEILRLSSQGISQRSIALSCECSRNTVAKVIVRAEELNLRWPFKNDVTDGELEKQLFPEVIPSKTNHRPPDLEYIHKEMAKNGVTLKLLWNEYCESCRSANELPLMYSQFCLHYQKFAQNRRATMHIHRKPGEQIEVDWAGTRAYVVDRDSGEQISAYLFVGVLSYSQYAYVEAFFSQYQESWIQAHVKMYRFFGGVSRILVPDNLKTGVEQVSWYTPVINKTYHEMSVHYDTAVIPARVRRPKDKPNAEGTVGNLTTWILAALRNEKFFTLSELNDAVHEKLHVFNHKPFQKKEGSRFSIFDLEEKVMLLPLPSRHFERAIWKTATVQFNYHIAVDKMHYSVPYEYIKHIVDVRITQNIIEVFYQNHRICSHRRLYGRVGQYSTCEVHMPLDHQQYLQWNAQRFLDWSEKVGPNTHRTVKAILSSHKVEQQGYKACMALLKLTDKFGVASVEAACTKALTYTPNPSFKSVKTILSTGQEKSNPDTLPKPKAETSEYGFTRGANYYGGYDYDK